MFEELARRGATVTQIVGGDPGCSDPTLVANSVRFTLKLQDGTVSEIHLFGFRDEGALANARRSLDRCRAEFADRVATDASHGAVTGGTYEAFGSPWSGSVSSALRDAIAEPPTGG